MEAAVIIRIRKDAFSLVEVALAIGLFSFCLIALMGLIPVALQTSRNSINRNTTTRMLQSVRASLLSTPSSTLATNGSGSFLFDPEGNAWTTNSQNALRFRVLYSSTPSTALPGAQTSTRLATILLITTNIATTEVWTNSLHLPDNGF